MEFWVCRVIGVAHLASRGTQRLVALRLVTFRVGVRVRFGVRVRVGVRVRNRTMVRLRLRVWVRLRLGLGLGSYRVRVRVKSCLSPHRRQPRQAHALQREPLASVEARCVDLQPYVVGAATVGGGGCNRMWRRLQPCVTRAAIMWDGGGCNFTWWRLQSYI